MLILILKKKINKIITNRQIISDYKIIKKNSNRWGIFLANGDEIIGVSHIILEDEANERFSNIAYVFIDERYRGQKLCSMLVEKTFKVLEEKNYGGGVIETVIAGGIPMLKCFLRVVSKLNYNIYSVPINEFGNAIRHKMKLITAQKALQIERRNFDLDEWQRLRFVKSIPKKQLKIHSKKRPKKQSKKRPKKQLKKHPKKQLKKHPKKRPKKQSKKK